MDEGTGTEAMVPLSPNEEQALVEARDALSDAREALLDERETAADTRDEVANERERAADARNHITSEREDATEQLRSELLRRAERLEQLIAIADSRDRAAELRDRAAETREIAASVRARNQRHELDLDEQDRGRSSVDRVWAGDDRDASASDRAALRDMARDDPKHH